MEPMDKISAVAKMQEYIEQHISDPIMLLNLAKLAGFSPWHTCRIFKELTGKTAFDYIRALRMSKAAQKLTQEPYKIIDIAFDFVFDTHEGFTRSFSNYFGISPREYRKSHPSLTLFLPTSVREIYEKLNKGEKIMSESKTNTVFVQVVDRPQRKLILKRGVKARHYFEYCEEVGCEVWETLTKIKEALYEPIGMWLPKNLVIPGTSIYAQGVEVPINYEGIIKDGYDLINLPPCKMMIFQGQPYDDEKFEDAISDLWDTMKRYNPEIYGFKWADEDGPRFQLMPMGYRGYIEGRPVRAV
jgi:AraC family transcriptional regulator